MSFYFYILSSLPMLKRDDPPPLDSERFLSVCAVWLDKKRTAALRALTLEPDKTQFAGTGRAAEKWGAWETCLRNAAARARAALLKGCPPNPDTRPEKDFFSEIGKAVGEAFALRGPLEREKYLDALRWRMLDSLEAAHPYSFDALCVYRLKLLIREKYIERDKVRGQAGLDRTVQAISADKLKII